MSPELGGWALGFVVLACLLSGFAHGAIGFGFPIVDRLGRGTSPAVQRRRGAFGLGFGFVAGVFEAIANVAGPVLLIYFMLLGLAPAQIVQILNLCFSMGKGAQTATWAASGEMTQAAWLVVGGLVVPSVAALFAGMRVRDRIDTATYRRWLRGALWIMALLLLGQFSVKAFASGEELFKAIDAGEERVAERLVRAGADVNARNADKETPLHRAAEKGMLSLARALVQRGADLTLRSRNGETALHLATLNPDPALVELLLAAGADPKARNDDGESVLMWACLSGNAAVARRLLARGADPNVKDLKGSLPLHAAADGGYVELIRLLLPRTADPDVRNRDGQSPADYARSRGFRQVENLLLKGVQ